MIIQILSIILTNYVYIKKPLYLLTILAFLFVSIIDHCMYFLYALPLNEDKSSNLSTNDYLNRYEVNQTNFNPLYRRHPCWNRALAISTGELPCQTNN